MLILKETCINQEKCTFTQGGQYFYCKKNAIIINYWYNTEFEIPIVGLPRYCNVPRLKTVAQKTVIPHSAIFSRKTCPLHNDVSAENISILTEQAIEWCNCLQIMNMYWHWK